jgi:hypothetical protein
MRTIDVLCTARQHNLLVVLMKERRKEVTERHGQMKIDTNVEEAHM